MRETVGRELVSRAYHQIPLVADPLKTGLERVVSDE